jgi:hypothetical protein
MYRVVILVLMMLIIIPLLTVNELDSSETIAVWIIGTLAALNYTDLWTTSHEVSLFFYC